MRTTILLLALVSTWAYAESPIADAAQRRDIKTVRSLATGAIVNSPQPDGTTALHWAAHWGDAEMVDALLKGGANANVANRFGSTPLSEATQAGNPGIVSSLLKASADAKTLVTDDGETVLMLAARAGHLEIVKQLVERGANVNAQEKFRGQTALMWAAAERHPAIVKYLLEHGADWKTLSLARDNRMPKLSAASSITPMARGGLTALHFAAREGDVESAKALLDSGADVNLPDADNTPAITVALMNKQYTFAKYLLDRGANPNIADARGRTPLYAALDARNEDYSALPTRKGDDPLPSIEIIRALLDKGGDPNLALTRNLPGRSGMDAGDTTLDEGTTPLMRAARAGDAEAMKLLVSKGADPKRRTTSGNDILLYAAGVGYRDKNTHGDEAGALESVKFSFAQGLDINRKNARGETALHGAAARGADSIVSYLVAQGAKMDERTNQGLTTLDYAMGRNITSQLPVPHDTTVDVLRKLGAKEGKSLPPIASR